MVKKDKSYEEMMEDLKIIVDKLEKQEVSLEESMKSYEQGINLCNKLYLKLNQAEEKIKILSDKGEEIYKLEEE
ncbi:MAG: exodeoxyribonuclease VII small subunit [Clostridiaceae bacterium]